MATRKGKKYARFSGYGDLMIPIALLEKLLAESFLVEMGYDENTNDRVISKIKEIDSVTIHDGDEIDLALAESKLSK